MKRIFAWTVMLLLGVAVWNSHGSGIIQQAYNLILDETTPQGRGTTLKFTGSGITCGPTVALVTPCNVPGGATSAYDTIQDDGTPLTQRSVLNFTGTGVTCTDDAGNTRTNCAIPAPAAQQHAISFVIDGGGATILTGALKSFPTAAFSCTINRIDVSADQSGSITVDIWKAAGAIPTGSDKISASAPATLSMAQLSQNGSLTGWTTAVSSGDVFGGTVASVTSVQRVTVQIWCQ